MTRESGHGQGLVLKVFRRSACVLTPDGAFRTVRAVPGMQVGDEWAGVGQAAPGAYRPFAIGAAIMAAAMACALMIWSSATPRAAAYVELEGRSAVTLAVSARGTLLSAQGVSGNETALADKVVPGERIGLAVEAISRTLAASGQASTTGLVAVVYGTDARPAPEGLLHVVQASTNHARLELLRQHQLYLPLAAAEVPSDWPRRAFAAGMSPGQYLLWQAGKRLGVTLDLRTLTARGAGVGSAGWNDVWRAITHSADTTSGRLALGARPAVELSVGSTAQLVGLAVPHASRVLAMGTPARLRVAGLPLAAETAPKVGESLTLRVPTVIRGGPRLAKLMRLDEAPQLRAVGSTSTRSRVASAATQLPDHT